jgi:hypothetical protein
MVLSLHVDERQCTHSCLNINAFSPQAYNFSFGPYTAVYIQTVADKNE